MNCNNTIGGKLYPDSLVNDKLDQAAFDDLIAQKQAEENGCNCHKVYGGYCELCAYHFQNMRDNEEQYYGRE